MTAPLAVILNFELGLRVCELVALKFSDIDGNVINIQRQVVRDFKRGIDNQYHLAGFKVSDHPKTYVSTLYDGGVSVAEIGRQVGHTNAKTTYESYIFNRQTIESTANQIQKALENRKDQPLLANLL